MTSIRISLNCSSSVTRCYILYKFTPIGGQYHLKCNPNKGGHIMGAIYNLQEPRESAGNSFNQGNCNTSYFISAIYFFNLH